MALTEFPNDLGGVYKQILDSIRAHKSTRVSSMAESALRSVHCAVRPLTPEELIEAVSFPNTASKPTPEILLDICRGFVVRDEGLLVFRFAHFSVQEFLIKHIPVQEGHAAMAEIAINYLSILRVDFSKSTLFDYATVNWPEHVRLSGERSNSLCIAFF